jgi:hypothetical protein
MDPVTVYIKPRDSRQWSTFTNVVEIKDGPRWVPSGYYRDGDGYLTSFLGSAAITSSGTGAMSATVPVVGDHAAAVDDNTYNSIEHWQSDELRNIPPRTRWVFESGIYIRMAASPGSIEDIPLARASIFTANAANNTISNTDFESGDVATVSSTTTIPPGLTVGINYIVVRADASNVYLVNASTGAIPDITGAGAGVHTLYLVRSVQWQKPLSAGILWFPQAQVSEEPPVT